MMRILFHIVSLLFVVSLEAQDTLPTGRIEVIKDFEVRLTETRKIRIVPQPIERDTAARVYAYTLEAVSPTVEYTSPTLKPLAIQPEQKPSYYPFVAKAGYGSPNAFMGLLSYDAGNGNNLHWGVQAMHEQVNNKKILAQRFSDTGLRLHSSYLWKEDVAFSAHVNVTSQSVYFYSDEDDPPTEDQLRRKFARYDVRLGMQKLYSVSRAFQYNAFLGYNFDKDDLGSREGGWNAGGEIRTRIGAQEYPVGMRLSVDFSKLKHNETIPLSYASANPFFHFITGRLTLQTGLNAIITSTSPQFLPDILIKFDMPGDRMSIRAGWSGRVHQQNFQMLSTINPYLVERLEDIRLGYDRSIFAGVNGSAGSLLYDLKGEYTSFSDKSFFLTESTTPAQFAPLYDDGSFIGFQLSATYPLLKFVALRVQGYQRFYSLDHEEKPWHTPSFGADAMLTYTGGGDAYHVSIMFHGENGLPYRTPGGTVGNLKTLLDLNLHGDYYVTDGIGVFAEINNILGNKRERWFQYPSIGFNARVGVLVRFAE